MNFLTMKIRKYENSEKKSPKKSILPGVNRTQNSKEVQEIRFKRILGRDLAELIKGIPAKIPLLR